jgi:flagellar basal body rod protein FlgG
MAIRGDGFFSVKKDNDVLLTRAGNFQVNARGELLTQQGYPVLAEGNAPVIIARPEMPWQVSASGDIQQAGDSQKLAIVKPASLGDLVKVGENLFRPLAPVSPVTNPDVAGGQLEASGSNPTSEMVEMIETTRAIEANLNLVQSQDQLADALFTRILKS